MGKTSLEKSHSKWSNTKLCIVCLLCTIFTNLFWASGAYSLHYYLNNHSFELNSLLIAIASLSFTFIFIAVLNNFTRD